MNLFWRIRYLDTRDREFKDRDLWLDTDELDSVTKAAVEACVALSKPGSGRGMLKFRPLFKPAPSIEEMHHKLHQSGQMNSVCIHDYHEDEDGNALSDKQIASVITGHETAVLLPPGAKQHDIDYIFAEKKPIDIANVSLSKEQLNILGYFARDLREMRAATFFKEGPGTLTGVALTPSPPKTLRTAVNDEEIRSFVTIFRRLYMKEEPANFEKAANVFSSVLAGHPVSKWISAGAAEIASSLCQPPSFFPFGGPNKPTFTVKRLIDVFLYTQYAHQPDERRSRQFQDCLREVGSDRATLTFLFLSELWHTALEMSNVGQHIAQLYYLYSNHHKPAVDVVVSAGEAHLGVGTVEKSHEREARIIREKAEELAKAMWNEAGQPPSGSQPFVAVALNRLRETMGTA